MYGIVKSSAQGIDKSSWGSFETRSQPPKQAVQYQWLDNQFQAP